MNRVQMRDGGLILWENEAIALISICISMPDQKYIKTFQKYPKMFQSMSLGICATCMCISILLRLTFLGYVVEHQLAVVGMHPRLQVPLPFGVCVWRAPSMAGLSVSHCMQTS